MPYAQPMNSKDNTHGEMEDRFAEKDKPGQEEIEVHLWLCDDCLLTISGLLYIILNLCKHVSNVPEGELLS